MPQIPRTGEIYPASPAQVRAGTDNRYAVTAAAAKMLLWGHGECRLTLAGASLVLQRRGLGRMVLGDRLYQMPVAGVGLAPTGLTADTSYFIYLFDNSGVLSLEASTTGYVQDATSGIMVKSGDPTRTLVGLARTVAGPAWEDSQVTRYVLSYYGRRGRFLRSGLADNRSVSATTYAELATEAERLKFLTWADETVQVGITATGQHVTGNTGVTLGVSVDGAITAAIVAGVGVAAGQPFGLTVATQGWVLSEGAHTAGIAALYTGAAGLIRGGSPVPPTSITGFVMG